MFKKLKDKLAEEVKSSPQRIQQFAQAAQAAVTSASSSISDITNSDLFSIGDNESQSSRTARPSTSQSQQSSFHDVTLPQSPSRAESESMDFLTGQDVMENQRQRRLSNSSFASDVSFRLPSYESPSMYHLQSDMEVSASEAEERGFSSGALSLDRVTKEQLYAAYRRTQDRYTKYRTQYADLARHYKLLERENAKARSVLVETQDKALRRISELKEQCSLEQSAKAHLEKALRMELEENNLKIEALSTKVSILQNMNQTGEGEKETDRENNVQLINISTENDVKLVQEEDLPSNESVLHSKIEKLEQLLNKYKESLKSVKEKNSQMTTELQILSNELELKNKENEQLKTDMAQINEAQQKIQQLNMINEDLQNKINSYDFSKSKEISTLELELQKSQEQITQLQSKIDVFGKREEEYAISLAENKLSIHKELEGKEAEIKALKDNLSSTTKEIHSLNIINNDHKNTIANLEEERSKLSNEINELKLNKSKVMEMESQILVLTQKCQAYEQSKTKSEEELKCLQLQMNQETAEKLAIMDRNGYLENRVSQLSDDNSKKSKQVKHLENELQKLIEREQNSEQQSNEVEVWKSKCCNLEREIKEEKEELINLKAEIDKFLANDELLQKENLKLRSKLSESKSENKLLHQQTDYIKDKFKHMFDEVRHLQNDIKSVSDTIKPLKQELISDMMPDLKCKLEELCSFSEKYFEIKVQYDELESNNAKLQNELKTVTQMYNDSSKEMVNLSNELNNINMQIPNYESQITLLQEKIKSVTANGAHSSDEVELLRNEKEKLINKLQEVETHYRDEMQLLRNEKEKLINKLQEVESHSRDEMQLLRNEINKLQEVETHSREEMLLLKNEKEKLINKLQEVETQSRDEMQLLRKEKEKLINELQEVETQSSDEVQLLRNEKEKLINKLQDAETHSLNEVQSIRNEKEKVTNKLQEVETLCSQLQDSLDHDKSQYLTALDKLKLLEDEKQTLQKRLSNIEKENEVLNIEVEKLKLLHKDDITRINAITTEKQTISDKLTEKESIIHNMEQKLQTLTHENKSLKTQTEHITNSLKNLELEIDEIRKSHNEIEAEKDRLNSVIEDLENKERDQIALASENTKDTQTECEFDTENNITSKTATLSESNVNSSQNNDDILSLLNNVEELSTKHLEYEDEINILKESNVSLSKKIQELSTNMKNNNSDQADENITEKYHAICKSYETLKEDNKRLQSDIEGLQAYLTKISKENGVLNDKLRESIATSENIFGKTEMNDEFESLKSETISNKEKIDDLMRENSLLIEENLELKDQLRSQNYVEPKKMKKEETDFVSTEKYNNLLMNKNKLEEKLLNIEQMNKSVDGNMQQLQNKNEKLRLTNEKLERRLDEALVSLRHLHSLQENTELEYLRNILYEYLTGSGTHSITLAKVLAAVVKFDDKQTQNVLQKEKERQGLLRQLGLL